MSDNFNRVYSHFYSEVQRIKFVVEKLKIDKNKLIVFDELFRGTNVKDAYDASLAVISALSNIKDCFFLISTHIIEVAEKLENNKSISFRKMEITHTTDSYEYTYLMKEGVSYDRIGLEIIKKENVIATINEISEIDI